MRGLLTFEPGAAPLAGENVHLTVQDTARADAAAVDIATQTIRVPAGFGPESPGLPFEIDLGGLRKGLTIRAHLARHAGRDVRPGDMVSTVAIPLPADDRTILRIALSHV